MPKLNRIVCQKKNWKRKTEIIVKQLKFRIRNLLKKHSFSIVNNYNSNLKFDAWKFGALLRPDESYDRVASFKFPTPNPQ